MKYGKWMPALAKTALGCGVFALGFNVFLQPNDLSAGGISGLALALVRATGVGSVGVVTVLINLPLFILAGLRLGKRFLAGSLFGMLCVSVLIDAFAVLPAIQCAPLLAALYGGAICGLGIGTVFATGLSTGGSDIVIRLLQRRWRNVPIGVISILFDFFVAAVTGIVLRNVERALYCGVAIFVAGKVIDLVVYRFDYSKVALIVSERHETIAAQIGLCLGRGATLLEAEGAYTGKHTKVILTAVRRRQLAELKQLVTQLDPTAFVIVQEAHQVLGDGFSHYCENSL